MIPKRRSTTMPQLSSQVALVTGASRGLGRGIAQVLAEQGADLVVNYHRAQAEADELVAEIVRSGGRALAVQADVAEAADVDRLFQSALDHFGRIDILVNNAGDVASEGYLCHHSRGLGPNPQDQFDELVSLFAKRHARYGCPAQRADRQH